MGGDGGATVKRDILVSKHQKRGLQQDIRLTNHGKTTNCALSGLPLKRPIVACELGMLYNKEAILTFLLEMSQLKSNPTIQLYQLTDSERLSRTILEDKQMKFAHITRLSDVLNCTVIMRDDDAYKKKKDPSSSSTSSTSSAQQQQVLTLTAANDGIGSPQDITNYIICPITNLAADGSLPCVIMRDCGCVMSLKGIDQINGHSQRIEDPLDSTSTLKACCLCLKPFSKRYQDGFKPIPCDMSTKVPLEEKNGKEIGIDQERLESFPLQDGEEPYIYLIPTESQFTILETVMLAKYRHLDRPLPKMVEDQIKRQRINQIDSSVDAQRFVQLDPIGLVTKK